MNFAESLRANLDSRGMTQKRLAKLVGLSSSQMSRACAGSYEPDGATLLRIENVLAEVPVLSFDAGTFAGALSAHMHAEKLTNPAVGELAGIDGAHISRLRTGVMSATETTMRRIAKALGLELVIRMEPKAVALPNDDPLVTMAAECGEPPRCTRCKSASVTSVDTHEKVLRTHGPVVCTYTVTYACGCRRIGTVKQ